MKSLLLLKHWQMFLLICGIPLIMVFIPLEDMSPAFSQILGSSIFVIIFLWIYSIGKYMPGRLDNGIKLSNKIFKVHIWIIFALMILIDSSFFLTKFMSNHIWLILLSVTYYLISVVIVFKYASKLLATIELGRIAKISDYIGYFFLFYFSPIGIWIIQPKIRKLYMK